MFSSPIEPMLSKSITTLPGPTAYPGGTRYEIKWDGFRCILLKSPAGVIQLQSRAGRSLTSYFPEIVRLAREHLPDGTILDGELILWSQGRLSFPLLQRRMVIGARATLAASLAHPTHLVAFDVLHSPTDGDVRRRPLRERRALLEDLCAGTPNQLALCPHTADLEQVHDWLATLPAATGIEGIVAKGDGQPYQGGRRGWGKYRVRTTTEAIIGGVTGSISRPETLLLGRRDLRGELRYVGRTRPLNTLQQRQLAAVLHPPTAGRGASRAPAWPEPLPATWLGQFRQPAAPLRYVPVDPIVVAEIETDTAYEPILVRDGHVGARWRHQPKLVRVRTDMSIYDVPHVGPDP